MNEFQSEHHLDDDDYPLEWKVEELEQEAELLRIRLNYTQVALKHLISLLPPESQAKYRQDVAALIANFPELADYADEKKLKREFVEAVVL